MERMGHSLCDSAWPARWQLPTVILAHLLPLSIPVDCRRGACCALWAAGWRTCTVRRAGACRTSRTERPRLA